MAIAGDEETDFVLSDLEADDETAPVSIDDVSVERFRESLAELDREKQARLLAEKSNHDLQVSFNRLKLLAHEAIKKRDESNKLKEQASREVERLTDELAETIRSREEISNHRDEIVKRFDEAVKAKESLRSEVETAAQIMLSGIDKVSEKANQIRNFTAGALPGSRKYSGLPAVAYGVITRSNEIVEELLRQIDSISKLRNEVREHLELRNYEIAIEFSHLREEVAKKTGVIEHLEKAVLEKDVKSSGTESELSEKLRLTENEALGLKILVEEYDDKLRSLENKMESQRPLLLDQLHLVSRIHDQLYILIKVVDMNDSDHFEVSEALFLPQATGMEESMRASLAGMGSIHELSRILVQKVRDLVEEKNPVVKCLNETVAKLAGEKERIEVLLRSALSKRLTSETLSKANMLFQVADIGLTHDKIDSKFADPFKSKSVYETDEDGDIYALAGALENIIEESQVKINQLQHSMDELRAESSVLKEQLEAQSKELNQKRLLLEKLEQKERDANESVEGLMMDVVAAEEEITRWKVAAEQEAAAGRAVEEDYLAKISAHKKEIKDVKQTMIELEKKLKFKEETAEAAMAARNAAEKLLALVETRASRLRERVEELTHQLEKMEARHDTRRTGSRPRHACWPWDWLGVDFVGISRTEPFQQQASNEMELSEPLI